MTVIHRQIKACGRFERGILGITAFMLVNAACIGLIEPNPSSGQPPTEEKKPGLSHRVVLVTGKEITGAVEVSVAINPTDPDHMIAVSQGKLKGSPATNNLIHVTRNGGRSWVSFACPNPRKLSQGDDVVTFTADGLAIHAFISFQGIRIARPKEASNGIITHTSRDGFTWNDPVPVIEHINSVEPFEDKPWIKADVSKESPHRGNLYVTWTKFDVYGSKDSKHKSDIFFARSVDAGKSFSVPLRISDKPGDALDKSNTVMGAVPTVGPKGEVYAVWGGPDGLIFAKSTDAGINFDKNKVIAKTNGWDFQVKGLGRCDGLPSAGVDLSQGKDRGSIFVTFGDIRNGDPDIFLIASRDGGETWSEPLRVHDDALKNGKEQFFGWMAVDPIDGAVNIVFYDRRDFEGTKTAMTLARSVDGGRTFVNHKISQQPFSFDKKGGFFGDYLGIDACGGRVAALYMHPREGGTHGLSAAIFDFEPGTQETRGEKKDADKRN